MKWAYFWKAHFHVRKKTFLVRRSFYQLLGFISLVGTDGTGGTFIGGTSTGGISTGGVVTGGTDVGTVTVTLSAKLKEEIDKTTPTKTKLNILFIIILL